MEENKSLVSVPVAIVVAGIIIGLSVVYAFGGQTRSNVAAVESAVNSGLPIEPVSKSEHIYGSPDAEVFLVEFSDLECPFCKYFHETLKGIVDKSSGKVAWVYRHSFSDGLHSKTRKEAEASECVASLGGNKAFWDFLDILYKETPSNDGLNLSKLPEYASQVGVDRTKFDACVKAETFKDKVNGDVVQAVAAGGGGTPWTIVVSQKTGKMLPVTGAQSKSVVEYMVKVALRE